MIRTQTENDQVHLLSREWPGRPHLQVGKLPWDFQLQTWGDGDSWSFLPKVTVQKKLAKLMPLKIPFISETLYKLPRAKEMSSLTWTGWSDPSPSGPTRSAAWGKTLCWFFIPPFSALQAMHCDLLVPLSKGWSHSSARESPLVSGWSLAEGIQWKWKKWMDSGNLVGFYSSFWNPSDPRSGSLV